MTRTTGAKAAPGQEAALVPPEYKEWAWPLLYPRMQELVEFGAKYARRWLLGHRGAARLPELLASDRPGRSLRSRDDEDELTKCAKEMAEDAFIAIYNHHQPLKPGLSPKKHLVSVINSIGANALRKHENWLRAFPVVDETIADPHLDLEPEEPPGGGKRLSLDRSRQIEAAARLRASLPRDWQFEVALVDAIGLKGLDDRRLLAQSLEVSLEQVNEGLDRIVIHVTTTRPELSEAIFEAAKAAVPAHSISAAGKRRDPPP
mgnify:CR=1 FL=1|jgi:hypothetical protein